MTGVGVTSVETIPVSVPVETGLDAASGDAGAGETYDRLLVRVTLADGTDGWGEVAPYPSWPGSGTFEANREALAALGDALRGREVAAVSDAVDRLAPVADAPFALAGVDVALHDAVARRRGVPAYDLLGGPVDRTLDLHHTLGLKPPSAVAEEARAAADRGFRDFKLKVGEDVDAGCRRAAALADAVPDARLRVDANGAWSPDAAVEAIEQLESAAGGLAFVEQPVAADDLAGMARVRGAVSPDVVADEGCAGAADVARLAETGAADGVNLKVANAGGLVGAREAAERADERGLTVLLGGMLELGVGAAASAHLGAAVGPDYPTGVFTRFAADRLVAEVDRWSPDGPSLVVSDEPGLGATVDRDAVSRYRSDRP